MSISPHPMPGHTSADQLFLSISGPKPYRRLRPEAEQEALSRSRLGSVASITSRSHRQPTLTNPHACFPRRSDRSPSGVSWLNSTHLLLTTPSLAREALYTLPVSLKNPSPKTHPTLLYSTHSVSAPVVIPAHGKTASSILFTRSSLAAAPEAYVLTEGENEARRVTHFTEKGLKGKDLHGGEEFWFEGAEGVKIQGWAILPSGFKKGEKKKWPMGQSRRPSPLLQA